MPRLLAAVSNKAELKTVRLLIVIPLGSRI